MCAQICDGQRSTLGFLLQSPAHSVFSGSLTGLEFTKSGRLPVCLSLTLQHWDSKGAGFWGWTQVLLFASHALYWLSHCPSQDSVFSGCVSWHYLLSSYRNFQYVTAYSPFHSPRHATSLFRRRNWGLGISNNLPKDLLGVEAAFRVTHNGLFLFLTWEGDNAETGICLIQGIDRIRSRESVCSWPSVS